MTASASALPRWDMTPFFPSLDSPEFSAAYTQMAATIQSMTAFVESLPSQETTAGLQELIERQNALAELCGVVATYVGCIVEADTRDTAAQARMSEIHELFVAMSQQQALITAWIGEQEIEPFLASSEDRAPFAYMLRRQKEQALHLMSPAEEALAAELQVTGATAWGKLHGDVTSQLLVTVETNGASEQIPMSAVRNRATDPSRNVRSAAYEAELAAWKGVETPIAAALNSIKGQVNTLSRRRHWDKPLAESLFENQIDQETLDAMIGAARESMPDFRRYLNAKARALGLEKLAWHDIFAPLPGESRAWEWNDATQFIAAQFHGYSPGMGEFAERSFREYWTDAEPREGKVGGAFCAGVRGDESRILMNFHPAFDSVSTLAHELGHGYHNLCLSTRPAILRAAPSTLAETASIFCETIIRKAGVREGTPADQLAILEASLQGATQIVTDITSRYLFEQSVFSARSNRELSADEFKAAMLQAQDDTYGDALLPDKRHPYMWAVKPHYYSTGSFYNYPYMFGMLFALGLYARYEQDPDGFKSMYDDLLSSTGMADAATLAAKFGIDTRSPEFWRASLGTIREDIDTFVGIVG
ncbi:oligoendopeptidase F [Capsulimonas corticalis]|uniref:Oligoendopeptidase F n=1 Tax=Capsulimonas corticalis TaxID=2219043 RepID=A0A402CYC5_9BACT|nr:M3 family oligoendopeptidase [Capsulimonas corticalis]BDI31415.1 oligoendopeptidase F [Capsulimonas corticalis]